MFLRLSSVRVNILDVYVVTCSIGVRDKNTWISEKVKTYNLGLFAETQVVPPRVFLCKVLEANRFLRIPFPVPIRTETLEQERGRTRTSPDRPSPHDLGRAGEGRREGFGCTSLQYNHRIVVGTVLITVVVLVVYEVWCCQKEDSTRHCNWSCGDDRRTKSVYSSTERVYTSLLC